MHPAGVQAVANDVVQSAEPVFKAVQPLEETTRTVISGGASDLVAGALQAFLSETAPLLTAVEQRIPAALGGLRTAAQAVVDGDDAMASGIDAQAASGFAGWTPPPGGPR